MRFLSSLQFFEAKTPINRTSARAKRYSRLSAQNANDSRTQLLFRHPEHRLPFLEMFTGTLHA
jgi:hypothetical protein